MTVKTFSLGMVIALIAAIVAAFLTIIGTNLLNKEESKLGALFTSTQEQSVDFVEIKNLIITLQGAGAKERYLLLELALATDDPQNIKRIEEMSPAVRGATVGLLSDMAYDDVRAMSVNTLREKLMASYVERFKTLNTSMPFRDVIISKMVFQ